MKNVDGRVHPARWLRYVGLKTRYAHCSSLNVTAGQYVEVGEVIGRVGNTGRSEGAHLHFEVIRYGQRVNPLPYIT
ncbi:MAG TPA: M23 family metallopeptidase [Candidatus Onthovicinus excrementipullorum]|nr:M23 family metallopeptidase [Candidatus Onthovicinus excrementipullorum]